MQEIFDNILEAIKYADPSFPIENILNGKIAVRVNRFNAIEIDGKIFALRDSSIMQPNFFRGEKKIYPSILPSMYRTNDSTDILISKLKIKQFETTLKNFPRIIDDLNSDADVDFIALAQHYGLNTNLIDITSNILVAAFFATNNCDKNYSVQEEGIGVLKVFPTAYMFENGTLNKNSRFHFEGIQPFRRPAIQDALGFEIKEDENIDYMFSSVKFKHNKKYNELIRKQFCYEKQCILFPNELISNIATKIKLSQKISKNVVEKFCIENNLNIEDIKNKLKGKIRIVAYPVIKIGNREKEIYYKELQKNNYNIVSRLIYKAK